MHTFSTEGIILKRIDFGEADRLVTVFTKNKGKITSLAKGIRRIESRRSGNVDLLNRVKLFFAQSKGLPILTEAEAVDTYKNLKKDLGRVGQAYYLIELTDQFFHDQQENFRVYDLLSESLSLLDRGERVESIIRAFELKILSLAGYKPQLFSCPKCRVRISQTENFLSPEAGGVLDKSCANGSAIVKSISPQIIKLMRFSNDRPLEESLRVSVPGSLMGDFKAHMRFYLEYILEKQLSSTNFAEKINGLG
ncbi:MAG: DNA repair protein RecO [Candidatus Woykebacteria bacterium]